MGNNLLNFSLKEYTSALADVVVRQLKKEFFAYLLRLLPAAASGPLYFILNFVYGWVFDWLVKAASFQILCKYADFRVVLQGSDLGAAITAEIIAKRGGDANAIKKAQEQADKAFDDFVIVSRY